MGRAARILGVLSACVLVTCVVGDGLCPCGVDPAEPVAMHDLAFEGDHLVEGQCVCQCGVGQPEGRPKSESGDCPDDGKACTDDNGSESTLQCY